jgi:protein farnesyltransferase/geranylgeranyltransferase type-1 subunit alpha
LIIIATQTTTDMSSTFEKYEDKEEWKDIVPIEQDDGENAPVPIAYTDEFKNTMNYFRAIVERNEISERALQLTAHAIELNPANYTAWYYRRIVLFGLKKDLAEEVEYMNHMTEENEKNYQVWYHRQAILEQYRKTDGELELNSRMIAQDTKNYHAWAHRQWVVKTFKLWDGELEYLDQLIREDVRNNSAWNHRFFVLSHTTDLSSEEVRKNEIEYAFKHIGKAPNNESPWNYAKGLANIKPESDEVFKLLEVKAKDILQRTSVNVHAHYILIDCYARTSDPQLLDEAVQLCDNLIRYDSIRSKYWEYKKSKLESKRNTI